MLSRLRTLLNRNKPLVVLMLVVVVLTAIPAFGTYHILGDPWPAIPPTFTDETFYYARMQSVVKGNVAGGNPYYLEHRSDPPLVFFAGTWVSALPQLAGLSFNTALIVNIVVWSLLFALMLFWFLFELRVPPWLAVATSVALYLESFWHLWRPVNFQPIFPFYFLFYIALLRLVRAPTRRNMWLLAFAEGAAFYFYAYLWQVALVTLALLILYAIVRKQRILRNAALRAAIGGVVLGAPVLLYVLWLSHVSPYFWESIYRLGLVKTHIPMAEVIYSGGWVAAFCVFVAVLLWRVPRLREDTELVRLAFFIVVSGLGLWFTQGSNLITGTLLETGEHIRILMLPWFLCVSVSLSVALWRRRALLSRRVRVISAALLTVFVLYNGYYVYYQFAPFIDVGVDRVLWQNEETYAKPFAWLNKQPGPVVVWADPHNYLSPNIAVFTKDYTLDAQFGWFELMPEGEVRERYLVSQYFNAPTVNDLQQESEMGLYVGRHDLPHYAKTLEREIKICRVLFYWDKAAVCGTVKTPAELLGEPFFAALHTKFQMDIVPNIKAYLKKYHVTYILKDLVLDPKYQPGKLGAKLVYHDERYEIYQVPQL